MQDSRLFFQKIYEKLDIPIPYLHFVCGSRIGQSVEKIQAEPPFSSWIKKGRVAFSEVPSLHSTSAPFHQGYYEYFYHKKIGRSICLQLARLHGYEGLKPQEVVSTVMGPRMAGTSRFILSNISGGLNTVFPVASVVSIKDHINFTGQSPLCGLSVKGKMQESSFLDMKDSYNKKLSSLLSEKIQEQQIKVCSGVYAGVLGPQLETPAEVRMLASAGADIVGMSTIWEVIALHHSKAIVSAVSVVSNLACGIGQSVEINDLLLQPCFEKLVRSFFKLAECSGEKFR